MEGRKKRGRTRGISKIGATDEEKETDGKGGMGWYGKGALRRREGEGEGEKDVKRGKTKGQEEGEHMKRWKRRNGRKRKRKKRRRGDGRSDEEMGTEEEGNNNGGGRKGGVEGRERRGRDDWERGDEKKERRQ